MTTDDHVRAGPTDDDVYVPTPFVVRARVAALVWPVVLTAVGLPGTRFVGGSSETLGDVFVNAVAVATALPTLPLFAALSLSSSVLVLALGAVTSLPVWVWGGAALARRVERRHGADWWRWARWYLAFPVVAGAVALLFLASLASTA